MVTFFDIGNFGRLGNQLFQISTIISYSNEYNYDWGIKKWNYEKYFKNKFPEFLGNFEKTYTYYETKYLKIENLGSNINFLGYFQSESYFKKHKEKIKNMFAPKQEIIDKIKKNNIFEVNNKSCVIHVRRGDYLKLNHFLGKEYYNESIKLMKENKVENFYIVSDDLNWCKENFVDNNFYFISNESDIEDLFFMTLFKNIIIANSSFSWWGAYLGEDKKVICPKTPFKDWSSFSDYYPENWIKIKN